MMGWRTVTIGEITELVTKGTTPTSVGYRFADAGVNFVKVESISRNGFFLSNKFAHIGDDCHDSLKRSQLKRGDILFSIAGALGRTAQVTPEILPANTNQALAIIRLQPSQGIMFEYVMRALSSGMLIEQIEKLRGGVAQQNLSLAQVKNFQIPLPPLPEQKRIVAILDEAFAGIDAAVANTQKNLANVRELFESYLNAIFTQKGDGWVEKTLGDVCANLDSNRVPITKSKRTSGEIPYYGASGVVDYVAGHLFDEDLLLVSEDGANLLARTYPIAFSISGKTWVNNHAHVLCFQEMAYQKFIEYYLNSISLEPYVSGMAQPKLNQKSLNSISVPWLPQLTDAAKVVGKLEDLSAETQNLESIYQQKLTALAELKQSILQKAFAGELTTSPEKTREKAIA